MLRNMNQPKHCNGTRLTIKKTGNNFIEAAILLSLQNQRKAVTTAKQKLLNTI